MIPQTNSAGMHIGVEIFEIEETENGPKPEDGPQDVSQDPEWEPGLVPFDESEDESW